MQMIAAFLVAVIVYFTDLSTAQISSGYVSFHKSFLVLFMKFDKRVSKEG